MPVRSLYLAKSGGGANQRSHFALFIPNAEYDRNTVHRNYNTQAYADLKSLVFLGKIDDSILCDSPETETEIREITPRSIIERLAECVTPPPRGQNIRAPIDGVKTKRCQEWTMEVLAILVARGLLSPEATRIAQRERDSPSKGIVGYKN
ncbi:hypothetical protein FOVSG1_010239 [Fusarium oxysporum f. sp. vasinfectum]